MYTYIRSRLEAIAIGLEAIAIRFLLLFCFGSESNIKIWRKQREEGLAGRPLGEDTASVSTALKADMFFRSETQRLEGLKD